MASRVDEMIYDESIDLDEIERKKIYKQRKEKKRVENLGIAYEKLAAKMASVHSGNEHGGRRRTPSRLSVLASALAHIKDLRQQMHMVANTSDSSDGEPTFRISQIPTAVTTVDRSSSSRRRRQGSSSTESSQYQSSSDSSLEITPTGLMPVYGGASDVLPSQDHGNHMLSPWLPANNIETEYCIENISILPSTGVACSSSSYVYCTCYDDQYHWQNGYYEYPSYAT